MDLEATKTSAKQMLDEYYKIQTEFPTQRVKSQWQAENKRGFFLGIIEHGVESHIRKLHTFLVNNQFGEQQEFSTRVELANPHHPNTFIDDMFDYYILPCHKDYSSSSSCNTPVSSKAPSRRNSLEGMDYIPKNKELTHNDLKKAVEKRDGVCLFCWGERQLHVAHIISQKDIPITIDEESTLRRAGLTQKHQLQNGLLLCSVCHGEFDQLKQYVDVVDNKLVVKFVDYSVFPNDEKHIKWQKIVNSLKASRAVWRTSCIDDRQPTESNGEMALYFVINNTDLLPSREALKFHKTACLIWRMAGGTELDQECCPDDDYCFAPIDYRSKNIEKWLNSSDTLITNNLEQV